MMAYYFDTDWDCLLITPCVSFHVVKCDHCDEPHDEPHGWAFSIGWLFWVVGISFEPEGNH